MDKRKLALTAGGASIVAAALAMNVGTAAAECNPDQLSCGGGGGDFGIGPLFKIESLISKFEVLDKASPVVNKLESVFSKLQFVFSKFD